jgi:hypothetical protein
VIAGIALRQLLVVVALVVACAAAAMAALGSRDTDDAFLARQEHPLRVTAEAVEKLMLTAPDPQPPHEKDATRSRCEPQGGRELRNPWTCALTYPSGSVQRYVVTINGDGSYVADYVGDSATATGCCLKSPAVE